MRLLDRLFTRRGKQPSFATLPDSARRRLAHACQELTDAELEMAAQLGLPEPPRLLLVDEEQAVVLNPQERAQLSPDRSRRG